MEYLEPLIGFAKANPEKLRISVFVDEVSDKEGIPTNVSVQRGRIDSRVIQSVIGCKEDSTWWDYSRPRRHRKPEIKGNTLVLVCGPERYSCFDMPLMPTSAFPFRMVSTIAGPYGRNYSQGTVGGILAELGLKEGQVWKL